MTCLRSSWGCTATRCSSSSGLWIAREVRRPRSWAAPPFPPPPGPPWSTQGCSPSRKCCPHLGARAQTASSCSRPSEAEPAARRAHSSMPPSKATWAALAPPTARAVPPPGQTSQMVAWPQAPTQVLPPRQCGWGAAGGARTCQTCPRHHTRWVGGCCTGLACLACCIPPRVGEIAMDCSTGG